MTMLRRWFKPPVFEGDVEKNRVARLAHTVLLGTALMITLASLVVVIALRNYAVMTVTWVSLFVPVVVALHILRRGYVRAASILTSIMLWLVLVVMGFLFGGVVNTSFTTIVIVIMISALLLGGRAGIVVAVWSFVAATVAFVADILGVLPPPLAPNVPVNYWVTHTVNYGIAALLLYLAMGQLTDAIQRAQRFAAESESQRRELQTLVQERTRDSERANNYLQATTAVAYESAAVMDDPQALLTHVVDVIREQYGFYHVGLYLLDETGEWAELRAVSGHGHELLARGFRARVGVEGIVGMVARRGEDRLVADVDQDIAYRRVAELPETRVELALPLLVRNEIIGVLDVQGRQGRVFSEQDVRTLRALAAQVAVAISNARLFEQARQVAEVERRAYGAITGGAWESLLSASQTRGFFSDERTTIPAGDLWLPEMETALQTGSVIQDTQEARRLAVPVKVRNEIIGVIDFTKPGEHSAWTSEEITLVESLTEQLGIALDSARLYQDSQRAAARERVIGQVSGRIRETLDMGAVLRTAAEQICQALSLEDLVVRLVNPESVKTDADRTRAEL